MTKEKWIALLTTLVLMSMVLAACGNPAPATATQAPVFTEAPATEPATEEPTQAPSPTATDTATPGPEQLMADARCSSTQVVDGYELQPSSVAVNGIKYACDITESDVVLNMASMKQVLDTVMTMCSARGTSMGGLSYRTISIALNDWQSFNCDNIANGNAVVSSLTKTAQSKLVPGCFYRYADTASPAGFGILMDLEQYENVPKILENGVPLQYVSTGVALYDGVLSDVLGAVPYGNSTICDSLTTPTAVPTSEVDPNTELGKLGLSENVLSNMATVHDGVTESEYTKSTGQTLFLLLMKRGSKYAYLFGDPNLRVTMPTGITWIARQLPVGTDIAKLAAELNALPEEPTMIAVTTLGLTVVPNEWILEVSFKYNPGVGYPSNTVWKPYGALMDNGETFAHAGIGVETFTCQGDENTYQVIWYGSFTSFCPMTHRDSFVAWYGTLENPQDKLLSESTRLFQAVMSQAPEYVQGVPENRLHRYTTLSEAYADWQSLLDLELPKPTPTATATLTVTPTATRTVLPTLSIPTRARTSTPTPTP